ncbi:MAG: cytochrome P450 [Rudaea sp.]
MKQAPPSLPGLPLLGSALDFARHRKAFLRRGYERIGPVFTFKLGPKPAVVLIGPDYQQFFFTETDQRLSIDKPYEMLAAIFGKVAFLASKDIYKEQRPILHAPFRAEKMVRYAEIMQREVQRWLDGLGAEGEIEITREMGLLVQQVAGCALMGDDFQNRLGREFWDLYLTLGKSLDFVVPPNWPTPKNIARDRAKQRMREMLLPIIAERRRNPEAYDDFLQDFVNTRGRSGALADDETVMALLRGLMFASHETTAGQAAWTVIELIRHPDYRALVEEEIAANLPPGRAIDHHVMRNLEHIAWAVREGERLHPSADILMRVAEEDIEVGDYLIPRGWLVVVSSAVAHRSGDLFQSPEQFDPLRYSPGRAEDKQHRFALIGFGGGVHKCAGMNFANNEMMIITALLFQQFELELVDRDPRIRYGMGAVRPTPTRNRYRRKPAASRTEEQLERQVA